MSDQAPHVAVYVGPGNRTNSGSGGYRRSLQPSKYEIHKVLGICRLGFWAIGLFLDPLVLYIFFIDYHGKRVLVDKSFGETISVVHAVVDFVNMILYVLDDLPRGAGILHICWSTICMFPLSLVIWILSLKMNTLTVWHGGMALLLQVLPRAIRLSTLCARTIPPSANFGRWALMFFYSYVFLGQVLGAMWYVGAVHTQTECWLKTKGLCLRNTTEFDFGVFRDVHRYGILEMRGSALKVLYCFGWAIQKISGLGSNLEAVGIGVLENLFAIFICFMSLMLFYILFGLIQVYLQSNAKKSMDTEEHLREIQQFAPFKKLPKDLQDEVIQQKRKQSLTGETRGANIEIMLDGLSENLRRKITEQLCLELVQSVEEFQTLDEASRDELYACLKPTFFNDQTCIIRENDPIKKIVLVVDGKPWTYTTNSNDNSINDSSNIMPNEQINDTSNEEVLCGELVNHLQSNPSTSKLPVSRRTIEAATNIQAFVVMAYDLKDIFSKCRVA